MAASSSSSSSSSAATAPDNDAMPAVDRTASLPLDFLVIGGGVGGLAVAYVLAKSGHRVRVLEKRDLDVPSGGHRVPPNLSKILRHWVGEEELMKVSSRCVGTPFHHHVPSRAPPRRRASAGWTFLGAHARPRTRMRELSSAILRGQSCFIDVGRVTTGLRVQYRQLGTSDYRGGTEPRSVHHWAMSLPNRDGLRTGDLVGYLHWKPAVMAETGGDFLLMHVSPGRSQLACTGVFITDDDVGLSAFQHDDLIRMLYKLATEAGARVDFHTEVTAIQPGSDSIPNPSVTLANGDVLTADMVVGADGYRSLVREVVLEEEDMAKPGGMTLYTGVVPAEEMLKDPELRPYALSDEWAIWMGPYRSVCGHPVRAKKEFFFHVYSWHGKDGLEQVGEENWEELFPTSDLKTENHGPKVQRMINLASNVIRTRFMTRPVIDDWTDYTGRIVLLGDAAHPSFPGGSHPAAMAVEDAVVFGSLFSHLRTLDQIPSFTSAYQELRQRRCELVKQADIANAQMVSMPDGPMAEARDEDMRRRKDEWDEGTLKAQFEEIAEIFLYDAGDAAEEWWVNWGRFSETAREQPHVVDFSNFTTVTVSQE
ncbi:hypothetical protein ACG7TL_005543 [Trametes sanguinea]